MSKYIWGFLGGVIVGGVLAWTIKPAPAPTVTTVTEVVTTREVVTRDTARSAATVVVRIPGGTIIPDSSRGIEIEVSTESSVGTQATVKDSLIVRESVVVRAEAVPTPSSRRISTAVGIGTALDFKPRLIGEVHLNISKAFVAAGANARDRITFHAGCGYNIGKILGGSINAGVYYSTDRRILFGVTCEF